jgi:hypothetical protein
MHNTYSKILSQNLPGGPRRISEYLARLIGVVTDIWTLHFPNTSQKRSARIKLLGDRMTKIDKARGQSSVILIHSLVQKQEHTLYPYAGTGRKYTCLCPRKFISIFSQGELCDGIRTFI